MDRSRGRSARARPTRTASIDDVDYHAVFAALTAPKLVLSPELMVLDANEAFLRTVDVPATAVVGRHYLDVFPLRSGGEPAAERVVESLERVVATGRLEMIGPHRYDLRGEDGRWEERWWITTNVPVVDAGGRVSVLVHRAEDVTDIVRSRRGPGDGSRSSGAGSGADPTVDDTTRDTTGNVAADVAGDDQHDGLPDAGPDGLVDRAVLHHALALGSTVGRYAAALVRERRAALELQDSILTPPPDVLGLRIDVRYRPAVPEVHVGGDWYDAFVQRDGSTTVVVGDVTGHDVAAASRMGHLRGIVRAVGYSTGSGPAALLDAAEDTATGLGLDALATAAVARVSPGATGEQRTLTWCSAGHLPPVVRSADGTARLLRARNDPLLGLGLGGGRTDHSDTLGPGDTLLLYTDGLVERRDRPLRDTLEELPGRVAALDLVAPGRLLDLLLTDLVPAGAEDDVALVAVHVER
ncbi:PP2C family protein-serine/threonine phosphatase [Cellulosimicrobium sp. Marseille-Q8652]